MKKPIIELKNVSKIYTLGKNKIFALDDISFKVNQGEFLVIIGKSGSGKTTLVNQIGCLDRPSKGKIILENKDISLLDDAELSKYRGKKIGYIFQKFNLIKTLSAVENVELPMIFQDVDKDIRYERAKDLLCKFDMKDRLKNTPSQLSGGQQQRVAIARALANDPNLILADEPTGNLDSKTGQLFIKHLLSLHKAGKTIILVTHDEKLSKLGNRTITLKDGKILKITKR